jgi:hypothetical protein
MPLGLYSNDSFKKGTFRSCFYEMITQEGKLSLWKGFPVYLLGVMFWMSVLPLIVDFATEKKNQYDGTSSKSHQS